MDELSSTIFIYVFKIVSKSIIKNETTLLSIVTGTLLYLFYSNNKFSILKFNSQRLTCFKLIY